MFDQDSVQTETALPVIEVLLRELVETKGGSDLLLSVGKPPQLRVYNEVVPMDYPILTAALFGYRQVSCEYFYSDGDCCSCGQGGVG